MAWWKDWLRRPGVWENLAADAVKWVALLLVGGVVALAVALYKAMPEAALIIGGAVGALLLALILAGFSTLRSHYIRIGRSFDGAVASGPPARALREEASAALPLTAPDPRPLISSAPDQPREPSEPLVPEASVERLREVYRYWALCFDSARKFLDESLCRMPGFWVGDHERNQLIADLIIQYLLPTCARDKGELDKQLTAAVGDVTSAGFAGLIDGFRLVVNGAYVALCTWIISAGRILVGDKLCFAERYGELYQLNQQAVEELRRVAGRRDIGRTAERANKLAQLLPEPLRRDPDTPLPGSLSDLKLVAAWEGRAAVVGRKWVGSLTLQGCRSNRAGCIQVEGHDGQAPLRIHLANPILEPALGGTYEILGRIGSLGDGEIGLSHVELRARSNGEVAKLNADEIEFLRLLCREVTEFEEGLEHPAMMGNHLYRAARALEGRRFGSMTSLGKEPAKERFALDPLIRAAVEGAIGCQLKRTEIVLDSSQILGTGARGGGAQGAP